MQLRLLLIAFALFALPLGAGALEAPEGQPLLTITGQIEQTNEGDAAVFDRAMLEAMEPVTYETGTVWTEGVQRFTGVPLARLMQEVGAADVSIYATAINDYAVEIPAGDWSRGAPIVAFLTDDAPMSRREKGPLWIIYPFDSKPEYRTETILSRSIWQLDRIVVGR
ncbi:oxidoreductase [Tropicimonas sp. IMCC34011]|uniref:oxidoreductase n=1 Tax=Tropicimonas sp. IMCC34011 TaxID=2248759 RepID=UPI000E24AA94|nr:oxidoreductase [Tropicimonas sp. IMCC34011]